MSRCVGQRHIGLHMRGICGFNLSRNVCLVCVDFGDLFVLVDDEYNQESCVECRVCVETDEFADFAPHVRYAFFAGVRRERGDFGGLSTLSDSSSMSRYGRMSELTLFCVLSESSDMLTGSCRSLIVEPSTFT